VRHSDASSRHRVPRSGGEAGAANFDDRGLGALTFPVVFRGSAPEFIAFWVGDRVLAATNQNGWDVQDDLQKLVRARHQGKGVDVAG
jgi:hypothetical protein